MILSIVDFMGDKDILLLCLIRTLKKYLAWTEQYRPDISNLYVSVTKRKKLYLSIYLGRFPQFGR